jgi:hypothetical protein
MAIKRGDLYKINVEEIKINFGAEPVNVIEYQPELAHELNEIVFEFDVNEEAAFLGYLRDCLVTGRILK